MNRAERRRRKERAIARMRRIVERWAGVALAWRGGDGARSAWIDDQARKLADNRQPCRASCCVNGRRLSGPTVSELRRGASDEDGAQENRP